MNNFKKIGLSALAGSLVAISAHAAEVSISGGASVAVTSGDDKGKMTVLHSQYQVKLMVVYRSLLKLS